MRVVYGTGVIVRGVFVIEPIIMYVCISFLYNPLNLLDNHMETIQDYRHTEDCERL